MPPTGLASSAMASLGQMVDAQGANAFLLESTEIERTRLLRVMQDNVLAIVGDSYVKAVVKAGLEALEDEDRFNRQRSRMRSSCLEQRGWDRIAARVAAMVDHDTHDEPDIQSK